MFSSPFPDFIAFVWRTAAPGDFDSLSGDERRLLSPTASDKRRAQFANGRLACHMALAQLGKSAATPVLMGGRGEPIWPEGLTGSITHSGEFAAVAAAKCSETAALGIDIERFDRELRHDIRPRVCRQSECDWAEAGKDQATQRTIALFSSKESIFKALYHLTGLAYRFKNMLLTPNSEGFLCTLGAAVGQLPEGHSFQVGCRYSDSYVFTYVRLER